MSNSDFKFNPIQEQAIERLRKVSAHIIALSPGTGKTILILKFIQEIFEGNDHKCIFMIPKSARAAFIKEITNRLNEPYYLIAAETSKKYSYADMEKHRYILIENTLVNKYTEDLITLAKSNTCHLVIDEAHSLQSQTSMFSKAAWEVRCFCKRVYAMTATPLINDIEGLFNLYHFVFPNMFTSWFKFRARYCITKERTVRMKSRYGAPIQRKLTEIIGYQNLQELNEFLDKLTIKGCIHYNVNFEFLDCELDIESEKPYRYASAGLFDVLYHPEKIKHTGKDKQNEEKVFAARLHDLSRIVDGCDTSVVNDDFVSNKAKLLLSKVKDIIGRNESLLIYFEYKESLDMIEKLLIENKDSIGYKKIYHLTGEEKEEQRAKVESNLSLKEIVLCTQAASQSRNLQRANNIIVFHCPFSVGRFVQVTGRICRFDSTYDTQNIYILSVKDTIDEYKITLFKDHLSLIKKLLGDEAMGAVEDCEYLDIDRSSMQSIKNSLLWRRDKR